jgi:[ribosomal protein S5]-alanine N-acetyltransferase
MKNFIETERLISREFTLNDFDFIIELLNSEGWIKNIGDRNVRTEEQAKQFLKNGPLRSYEVNGFGFYLVALKESGMPIGMCGLIERDYLEDMDIGFAFLPQFTGKGYACEIARETLRFAFEKLEKSKIAAITLPTNPGSINLLKKLGLTYEKNIQHDNEELMLFGITKVKLPVIL